MKSKLKYELHQNCCYCFSKLKQLNVRAKYLLHENGLPTFATCYQFVKKKKIYHKITLHDFDFQKKQTNPNALNVRRNIREVMDEKNLDASTLAAQRQESERLARVQEQQRIIREVV